MKVKALQLLKVICMVLSIICGRVGGREITTEEEVELNLIDGKLDSIARALELLKVSSFTGHSLADSCEQMYDLGYRHDGIHYLNAGNKVVKAYCERKYGESWLIIQRRRGPEVDFFKSWDEYRRGFGDYKDNFWIGLEALNLLTASQNFMLRIEVEDFENHFAVADYSVFSVGDAKENFRLNIGGYRGTAGDSLKYHNGKQFSTKDRDNDENPRGNCAQSNHGGWWFAACHSSNLNGKYIEGGKVVWSGIIWATWKNGGYSLKSTTMKIRLK